MKLTKISRGHYTYTKDNVTYEFMCCGNWWELTCDNLNISDDLNLNMPEVISHQSLKDAKKFLNSFLNRYEQ